MTAAAGRYPNYDPAGPGLSTAEAHARAGGLVVLSVYTRTGRDTGRLLTLTLAGDAAASLGRQLVESAALNRDDGRHKPEGL